MTGIARSERACFAERGTTLIELLVVLAIMGLLAAIAAAQMIRYFAHGQDNAAHTEISTLSASLHLFRSDVGRYPTTQEGLGALLQSPRDAENWSGPYVKRAAALEDPWGHRFVYRSPGAHAEFDLYSLGPKSSRPNDAQSAAATGQP